MTGAEGLVTQKMAGETGRRRNPQTGAEYSHYTPAERRADAVVHTLGLALGLAACVGLVAALPRANLPHVVGLGLYAVGLMSMLGCSALYNNLPSESPRKALLYRFDHAAIFLMIAGTYTPIALLAIGGAWGAGMLAFVWMVAGGGMALEPFGLRRCEDPMIALYLLLGWTVLVGLNPLLATIPPSGLALLAAGSVLYSLGVVFHLWERLPYQNVIWHGFVLAAATCHYAAILREV